MPAEYDTAVFPDAAFAEGRTVPVEFKPNEYHTVTPYLVVDGAAQLIEFMVDVLGGTELMRLPGPEGRLGHAEVRVGDSVVMLADAPSPRDAMPAMLRRSVDHQVRGNCVIFVRLEFDRHRTTLRKRSVWKTAVSYSSGIGTEL